MSIPFKNQRIVKLSKEEYNLIIIMRYKIPYGEISVKVHNGKPTFIERGVEKTSLQEDLKNITIKEGLDFSQEKKHE